MSKHSDEIDEAERVGKARAAAAKWEQSVGMTAKNVWVENPQPTMVDTEVQTHVDPSHYKGHIADMQWVETEWELAHGDVDRFLFAMLVQMRKYHARLGQKDKAVQELRKSAFYLLFGILAVEYPDKRPSAAHVQKVLKML